jgi:hypothetical protein
MPGPCSPSTKLRLSRARALPINANGFIAGLEELDGIIDGALRAPLSESDGRKLKMALHTLAEKLVRQPAVHAAEIRKCIAPGPRK